jgi:hypothetical protein
MAKACLRINFSFNSAKLGRSTEIWVREFNVAQQVYLKQIE